MDKSSPNQTIKAIFTILSIIVGWHFLYQGISKLMIPEWSSFSYLMESKWLFSGFFHWIATNPEVLKVVDLINIWSLILIGLLLMLGLFRRPASIAGIFLLLIYRFTLGVYSLMSIFFPFLYVTVDCTVPFS